MAAYSILKHHNLNHHDDYYRTISKIISGILTMVYSAVNHSYDSKRTIKIISGRHNMAFITIQNTLSKFWLSDNIFTSTGSNWTKLNWSPELCNCPCGSMPLSKTTLSSYKCKGKSEHKYSVQGATGKDKKTCNIDLKVAITNIFHLINHFLLSYYLKSFLTIFPHPNEASNGAH